MAVVDASLSIPKVSRAWINCLVRVNGKRDRKLDLKFYLFLP
jgi:hypothetical protein